MAERMSETDLYQEARRLCPDWDDEDIEWLVELAVRSGKSLDELLSRRSEPSSSAPGRRFDDDDDDFDL